MPTESIDIVRSTRTRIIFWYLAGGRLQSISEQNNKKQKNGLCVFADERNKYFEKKNDD